MKPVVAIIGLGVMGQGIGENLRHRSYEIIGCDRDQSVTGRLAKQGWTIAPTLAEATTQADVTICMVATTAQTEAVMLGEAGVIANAPAGRTILCMNTIDPLAAARLHDLAVARGLHFLDTPVSGGRESAVTGKLSMMVGGSEASYEACRELLTDIASKQFYIGKAGQGMAMKHVNNMLAQINIVAMCEAFVLGAKAGIEPRTIYDVVRASSGGSYIFEKRGARILAGDFERRGSIDICYKDQELQTAFAKDLGVPLLVASITQQVYLMAKAAGLGSEDAGSLIKMLSAPHGIDIGDIETPEAP